MSARGFNGLEPTLSLPRDGLRYPIWIKGLTRTRGESRAGHRGA